MTRAMAIAMLGIALMTGCAAQTSYPAASPADPFSPQARCERDGGRWHADRAYSFCEYQSPGLPLHR